MKAKPDMKILFVESLVKVSLDFFIVFLKHIISHLTFSAARATGNVSYYKISGFLLADGKLCKSKGLHMPSKVVTS